ncbi:hypothetical protein CAG99_17220 [Streptomyces marincola]|uniref:Uncharacterized protein n=1 Tax=Streptomyces marincola TaxID=2878388 RepID=A0A1W7D004_9ACTN|nr:hypothetical protein CAG99_17220 [Streptomyces marincola]
MTASCGERPAAPPVPVAAAPAARWWPRRDRATFCKRFPAHFAAGTGVPGRPCRVGSGAPVRPGRSGPHPVPRSRRAARATHPAAGRRSRRARDGRGARRHPLVLDDGRRADT